MPSFATFSPALPNNVPSMVLPVYGPPRLGPLGVWSPSRLISYRSQGFPGFYKSSIQKITIPLLHRLLVLIPKAVAWLRCYHALQERVPKRWALSYHYLTKAFMQYQWDRVSGKSKFIPQPALMAIDEQRSTKEKIYFIKICITILPCIR